MTIRQHWEQVLAVHIGCQAYRIVHHLVRIVHHNRMDPFYPFHELILHRHPLDDAVHDDCYLEGQLKDKISFILIRFVLLCSTVKPQFGGLTIAYMPVADINFVFVYQLSDF